jgi:acetyl-CoA C-acetyltransferase
VHGNGYYLTKHSVGLYSRHAPGEAPRPPEGLQETIDGLTDALVIEPSVEKGATGTVVAYTVPFDRERGPQSAVGLVDVDGRRTIAHGDEALTTELLAIDGVGTGVVLDPSDKGNTMRGA